MPLKITNIQCGLVRLKLDLHWIGSDLFAGDLVFVSMILYWMFYSAIGPLIVCTSLWLIHVGSIRDNNDILAKPQAYIGRGSSYVGETCIIHALF